jgi:DNA-directed RNA polymerase specialized sigma24 family protein
MENNKYKYNGATKFKNFQEKLFIEIRQLSRIIVGNQFLTEDEITDCVNDAYVSFTQAQKRMHIDISSYDNYKGYLYLVVRNKIYLQNKLNKAKQNNFVEYEIERSYDNQYDDKIEMNQRINSLTQFEKSIWNELIQETPYRVIAKKLNIKIDNLKYVIKAITKKIFPNYKGNSDKYAKRKKNGQYQPITKYVDYEYNDFYAE